MLGKIHKAIKEPAHALRVLLHICLVTPIISKILNLFGGTTLLAFLTSLTVRPLQADDRPVILVLNRLFFEKDVAELQKRGKAFHYLLLDTHILSISQQNWLRKDLQEQISYAPRTTAQDEIAWKKCALYATKIVKRLRQKYPIVATLSSNVDYWQHECFRQIAKEIKLPFLVLNQELQTVPFVYADSLRLYRQADFHYTGHSVAVFGKETANMLIECSCCTKDQVEITGAPRLDPWFDGSLKPQAQDTMTLLSYTGDQYLAPKNAEDVLHIFARASEKYTNFRFVLKCKDYEDELRARDILKSQSHKINLSHSIPLPELFMRSRLVVGYNSLAVIEALLSPAEVVIPFWSDAARPRAEQIFHPDIREHRETVRFIDSPSMMQEAIANAADGSFTDFSKEKRLKQVAQWFYIPHNSTATECVEAYISKAVGKVA